MVVRAPAQKRAMGFDSKPARVSLLKTEVFSGFLVPIARLARARLDARIDLTAVIPMGAAAAPLDGERRHVNAGEARHGRLARIAGDCERSQLGRVLGTNRRLAVDPMRPAPLANDCRDVRHADRNKDRADAGGFEVRARHVIFVMVIFEDASASPG